ncbi:MAG: hypothetical protein AB7E32_17185 [Desulfovibrio sp.]
MSTTLWMVLVGGGLIGVAIEMRKSQGRLQSVAKMLAVVGLLLCLVGVTVKLWPEPSITPSFSEVKIKITEEGKIFLSGKSSLPDGTRISALILETVPSRRGLFIGSPIAPDQWDVVVQDGKFESWFPTAYEKGVKAGKYMLQIGVLPDQEELLGPKNSWLKGPEVVTETNGHHTYAPESELALPDIPAHADQ